MRFPAFILFSVLWAVFVYSPVAHWVWGGGWLDELGAIDFAGGNVVHISSGVAGLVVAIVLGKRKNISDTAPHNLLLTLLGATLIWFGWFGFNVGSALTIDEVAMTAFINTNTAAAAGLIGWILAEWLINKSRRCSAPSREQSRGLFATTSVNADGANGLFYGDISLLWKQLIAIAATYLFVAIVTYAIIKIVSIFFKLRASEDEESLGLDLTLHGEKAYQD